jgi:hypothetical protein
LPDPDGKLDEWGRSALNAAERATHCWVRVVSNKNLGAYEVYEASARLIEPAWPEVPFSELLRITFRDCYIDSLDHPVLRRLRGEV